MATRRKGNASPRACATRSLSSLARKAGRVALSGFLALALFPSAVFASEGAGASGDLSEQEASTSTGQLFDDSAGVASNASTSPDDGAFETASSGSADDGTTQEAGQSGSKSSAEGLSGDGASDAGTTSGGVSGEGGKADAAFEPCVSVELSAETSVRDGVAYVELDGDGKALAKISVTAPGLDASSSKLRVEDEHGNVVEYALAWRSGGSSSGFDDQTSSKGESAKSESSSKDASSASANSGEAESATAGSIAGDDAGSTTGGSSGSADSPSASSATATASYSAEIDLATALASDGSPAAVSLSLRSQSGAETVVDFGGKDADGCRVFSAARAGGTAGEVGSFSKMAVVSTNDKRGEGGDRAGMAESSLSLARELPQATVEMTSLAGEPVYSTSVVDGVSYYQCDIVCALVRVTGEGLAAKAVFVNGVEQESPSWSYDAATSTWTAAVYVSEEFQLKDPTTVEVSAENSAGSVSASSPLFVLDSIAPGVTASYDRLAKAPVVTVWESTFNPSSTTVNGVVLDADAWTPTSSVDGLTAWRAKLPAGNALSWDIAVSSRDLAGNVTSKTLSVTLTDNWELDTAAPEVHIVMRDEVSVPGGSGEVDYFKRVSSAGIYISDDNLKVDSVQILYVTPGLTQVMPQTPSPVPGSEGEYFVELARGDGSSYDPDDQIGSLHGGEVSIVVIASDEAGNTTTYS